MATGTEAFYMDPTFWVAGSFVVFVVLVAKKVATAVGGALDEHSNKISKQITEAKELREEAEQLLADYQRKQRDAEGEAAAMIAQANDDAKILADAAKADIDAMIDRRSKVAADKIKQAEAAAVKQVRAAAVDVAVVAARQVLADGKGGKAMTDAAIAEVASKLH